MAGLIFLFQQAAAVELEASGGLATFSGSTASVTLVLLATTGAATATGGDATVLGPPAPIPSLFVIRSPLRLA